MLYLILLIPTVLFAFVYFFWLRKKNVDKLLKILSVILFITYTGTLYYPYAIDKTYRLEGIFSVPLTIFMFFLRWFTVIGIVLLILSPFFKENKAFKHLASLLTPILFLLNLILIRTNLIAIYGPNRNYFDMNQFKDYGWILYFYLLTMIIVGCQSMVFLHQFIKNKEYKSIKDTWKKDLLIFVLLLPAYFPQAGLQIFFGKIGSATQDFTPVHRFTLYFSIAFMLVSYLLMRHKTMEEKRLFYAVTTLSAFLQYFYVQRLGLSGLPLHLCNTAVMLMFFGFVFNSNGIFYFTYFVNVLGALLAMLMPSNSCDAFHIVSVHFWYNHIYAFTLPILGVAIGVYKRPNLKMIRSAIGIFSLYFLLAATLNAWFNNYVPQGADPVDYFFIYSDFFTDKFAFAVPLKQNFILDIPIGNLTFRYFWLYQIVIYLVYILLMFLIWLLYDYLFKVSDAHYALLMKKRMDKMDMLNLKKELDGRPISSPIDLGGTEMIKIDHFTKMYGNSKVKSVDDFSLEVHDGEVFGFLGHNGAGKSTTIKSMVGIQSITSGRILIDGYDVAKQPLEAKLRMGYVSDNHAVYERLTGREYINYVADLYLVNQKDRDERIEKYVKMFKLEDAIDREIKGYSHGMKQKIVVIASLIHNPKVWILDEPLTGLDPTSSYQIKECMREHANNGNIVFFSSHVIEVVEKICDRICIISHGKLQGVYSLKELKEQGISLEELYLKHVANEK